MMNFVALTVLASAPATPCLWDRDTLAVEAKGAPAMVEVLVGRFDRFPDEYYEVRLERLTKDLERQWKLADFDDAAVACDRLGRPSDAIEWMARKRAILDGADSPQPFHEYTYKANLGTFHIHRWLKTRDRSDLADAVRAEELIAAAIAQNPAAHFGREKYQLLAIRALLDPKEIEHVEDPTFLNHAVGGRVGYFTKKEMEEKGFGDAAVGVAGLIHLGAAWEAAPIWLALEQALHAREDAWLARLAALRVVELYDAVPARAPEGFNRKHFLDEGRALIYERQLRPLDQWYREARQAAEAWRVSRNEYLLARLKEGTHPDDDPDGFWKGWTDEHPLPAMPKK